jgi:hypothetical protein
MRFETSKDLIVDINERKGLSHVFFTLQILIDCDILRPYEIAMLLLVRNGGFFMYIFVIVVVVHVQLSRNLLIERKLG